MDEGQKQALLSALRSVLIAIGGYVTGRGWLDSATVNEIIGLAMVLIPAAWGVWHKFTEERKTKDRENDAVKATVEAVKDSAVPKTLTPAASQAIIKEYAP